MQEIAELLQGARSSAGLTQDEVARRAGTSQPAVARYEQGVTLPTLPTLRRLLVACGRVPVISTRSVPRDRSARIGPHERALARHRSRVIAAGRRHGTRNLRVFGSIARGEERSESDVDLLVDLEPGRTLVDLAGFRREVADILGVEVDAATEDMLKPRARKRVLAEAQPL
jgi:predicted nucleotidyltransferase/DNA-binding XRE family transcriptional regulator